MISQPGRVVPEKTKVMHRVDIQRLKINTFMVKESCPCRYRPTGHHVPVGKDNAPFPIDNKTGRPKLSALVGLRFTLIKSINVNNGLLDEADDFIPGHFPGFYVSVDPRQYCPVLVEDAGGLAMSGYQGLSG